MVLKITIKQKKKFNLLLKGGGVLHCYLLLVASEKPIKLIIIVVILVSIHECTSIFKYVSRILMDEIINFQAVNYNFLVQRNLFKNLSISLQ